MNYPSYEHLELREKTLAAMQRRVKEINEANGWFDPDKPRSFGDDVALLHSEVSEAFEAYRDWDTDDKTEDLCTKGAEFTTAHDVTRYSHKGHVCKPEGVGSELADVLVRLLDTCERYDIDLQFEFDRKLEYNATRGYRHGGKRV